MRWGYTLSWLMLGSATLHAQPVIEDSLSLPLHRPEAWAMATASQSAAFSGFGPATAQAPGALRIGAELGSIPHLSTERRRVGFDGTKLEDLNKSPVFGRLRAWIGLPADVTLELGWTPPVAIGGARARDMVAVALERPLWQHGAWRSSLRLAHRRGEVEGDITCDAATAAEPPGSSANPFGCRTPSRDRFRERADSIELVGAFAPAHGRWQPFLSVAHSRLRLSTQVDAQVFGVIDRSRLQTRGSVGSAALGVLGGAGRQWEWLAALQWTPLEVRRQGAAAPASDDLWSLRLMLRRSVH